MFYNYYYVHELQNHFTKKNFREKKFLYDKVITQHFLFIEMFNRYFAKFEMSTEQAK